MPKLSFPRPPSDTLVLGGVSWDKLSVRTRLAKSRHTISAMVHVPKEIDVASKKRALFYFSDVGPFFLLATPDK